MRLHRNHHWQTLFSFLVSGLTRRKTLYTQEFLIVTWLHVFTLKADAQCVQKEIQVFSNCYLAVPRQTLCRS